MPPPTSEPQQQSLPAACGGRLQVKSCLVSPLTARSRWGLQRGAGGRAKCWAAAAPPTALQAGEQWRRLLRGTQGEAEAAARGPHSQAAVGAAAHEAHSQEVAAAAAQGCGQARPRLPSQAVAPWAAGTATRQAGHAPPDGQNHMQGSLAPVGTAAGGHARRAVLAAEPCMSVAAAAAPEAAGRPPQLPPAAARQGGCCAALLSPPRCGRQSLAAVPPAAAAAGAAG